MMRFRISPLAAAVLVAYAVPGAAQEVEAPAPAASETLAPAQQKAVALPAVTVEEAEESPYKAQNPQSPKYTEPLRDTPQTITVVPKEVMHDQNLFTLRDILSTVPGITFGAGEGGGGYGDSITIRGFTGSSDIAVDGVRDSAQYTRSDSFNLEQVEVVNGASSVYSGAGAVGGTVNLVSKRPTQDKFINLTGGLGTDSYGRATLDANQPFADGAAARLNVMVHKNDAPGRDYENFERWGVAPSVVLGLGSPTQFTLSYFHQHDKNIPQYGVPFYNGQAVKGIDSENYYGYHDVDTQKIDNDTVTGIIDHKFNDTVGLRNLTRWGKTTQLSIVDPPQGTFCLSDGTKPVGWTASTATAAENISGYAACTSTDPAPGFYQPSGPRGNTRDTDNTIATNITDLTWKFDTAGIGHTLVTGFSVTHENFDLESGSQYRNADGSPVVYPPMDVYNPDSNYPDTLARNYFRTGQSDGELDNRALYAFDTIKFGEHWQLGGGLRYERNEGSSTTYTIKTYTAPTTAAPTPDNTNLGSITGASVGKNDDDLLSYRGSLLYKPVEAGSIYIAYGNSETPSKASVNGSCTVASTVTGGVNQNSANCTVEPEKAVSYEIGTKWELFGKRLLATAAIFRNDRENYRVSDVGNPDNPTGEQQIDGESRVDGLELSVSGNITDKWAAFANYTYLDSEVLQGVSDFVADNGQDYTKGDHLTSVPENAFNIWTTYQLPYRVTVGYGAHYEGGVYLTQHSATNQKGAANEIPLVKTSDYWVHRMLVSYAVSRKFDLRLNVNNLFDKEYYARGRNNGWATPGDARSFVLSTDYTF